jgi:MFS family permease
MARSSSDVQLLFITRCARLFAYGGLSVILMLYLTASGMSEKAAGALLTFTLIGDTVISLFLTTRADRFGRRLTLIAGAMLMVLGGLVFALTANPILLLIAATIGVISPSGYEVGPFLAIEQASLAHIVPDGRRTSVFAWYNLAGYLATAAGSLGAGLAARMLQQRGWPALSSYRIILFAYAAIGAILAILFAFVSGRVEVSTGRPPQPRALLLGLHKSRSTVLWLSGLFSIDAFAGGFVTQTLVAWWFVHKFAASGATEATMGAVFFATNILAGFSALAAVAIARRIGLINTMVFTHAPSNILLMLVPLMPSFPLAVAMLLLRSCLSQMDVPARQSYVAAVVDPDERSAAAGVTGVARTTGSALSPSLAAQCLATPALMGAPFLLAGGLKLIYDLILFISFRARRTPEETPGVVRD